MSSEELKQPESSFGDKVSSKVDKVSSEMEDIKGRVKKRFALEGEISAANKVLTEMAKPKHLALKQESKIPYEILQRAQGLAFYNEVKAGLLLFAKGGTGIVVARLPGGGWSGPSSFGAGGVGAGLMMGVSRTENIIVLNTKASVGVFAGKGHVKLGGDIEVTAGPVGRDIGGAVRAGGDTKHLDIAPCYSYSHSQGLFAGISVDGTLLITNHKANAKFYGKEVLGEDILSGLVKPPECAALEELHATLRRLELTEGESTYMEERQLHL